MRTIWRLAFWITLLAVTAGSLAPVDRLPSQTLDIWDKAQHSIGFLVLTLLALPAHPTLHAMIWGILLAAYGAIIEWLQHLSGWRTGDPLDWLADAIGIAVALAVHHSISCRKAHAGKPLV
jgi:VanZ family protein